MRGSGTGGGDTGVVYYSVNNYGRLMGIYTAPELNRLIGIPRLMVGRLAESGKPYRDWYTFERLTYNESLMEEWKRVVEELRSTGYDLGRVKIVQRRNGGGAGGINRK